MLKKSIFAYAFAIIMAALLSVNLVMPAFAADLTQQTLTAGSVSVAGLFEEEAVLTATTADTSEAAEKELLARKQISNGKNIIAVYDISVSGEQPENPIYSITIKDTKLNPLIKNKISVIDKDGEYFAISGFVYNKNTVTFKTDTLGQIIIYKDPTIFYVAASVIASVILLIIALKVIEAKRFKSQKNSKKKKVTIRERDKKYDW